MKKIQITLCQFEIKFQNPYQNWEYLKKKLTEFLNNKEISNFIVLPELCFFGVITSKKEILGLSQEIHKIVEELTQFSREHRLTICTIMPIIKEDMIFNTTIVFFQGQLIEAYSKINLFPPMKEHLIFEKGSIIKPVTLKIDEIDVNVGFLTCFDLRFPELARQLSTLGAEIIIVNALWPIERIHHFSTLLQARAIENQLFVAGINSYGRKDTYFFGGKSCLIAPDGKILALMTDNDKFLTCTIDLEEVTKVRQNFNTSFLRTEPLISQNKILSLDELTNIVNKRRRYGEKMVFTNGCFDILHAGHVAYLKEARMLGDFLVVGLNSDNSVRRIKGEKRPINSETHRAKILESLQCVDYITIFEEDTPINLISSLIPDVLVKGADWKENEIVGADLVKANGGVVKTIKFQYDTSTTKILEKIKSR